MNQDTELSPAWPHNASVYSCMRMATSVSEGLQVSAKELAGVVVNLNKVERGKFECRLLQVKGRRNIRIEQTRLAWSSMNSGDVFLLDMGLTIYVWNGSQAGRLERVKGMDIARRIRDEERGGKAEIEVMDQENMLPQFLDAMRDNAEGTPADIQEPTDDSAFEKRSRELVTLYRVSDASGSLEVTPVGKYPLKREMLDTKDAFIVDTGAGGVYGWVGKRATQQEKKAAYQCALDLIEQKGYPSWTNVTCLREGTETPLFKQNFANWVDKNETTSLIKPVRSRQTAAPKFDVLTMHKKKERKGANLVDDGSGTVEIYRIEDFHMVPLDLALYGQFFGGDSYVILYTYLVNNRENYIIYFWQGQESSQDEKAAAAIHAFQLDDKYGGAPVQVRVVQNKEPDHFLLVFKGRMVVHAGGRASGFKNRADTDSYDVDGTRLFHVRGTNELNTRAVQVEEKASSLNSNDCFVLETPPCTYIWHGKGSSDNEHQLADKLAGIVSPGREPVKITEGSEPPEFWDSLGGKMEYASGKWLEEVTPSHPPRLFQCSNASGRFNVEEVFDFAQEDLDESDVMILDTYSQVFVWVGREAREDEVKEALKITVEYVRTDPSNRDIASTELLQVKQGFEPPTFSCHFLGWNPNLWTQDKSYETYLKQVTQGVTSVQEELKKYDEGRKYPYEQLKGKCPQGVNPTMKETYLTEEDFKKVFDMTPEEFRGMPKWKQMKMKKNADLF